MSAWAFEHPEIEQVTAETLPGLAGSIRVMEKCGMRFVGEGTPEGDVRTVRYAVSRAEFRPIPDRSAQPRARRRN